MSMLNSHNLWRSALALLAVVSVALIVAACGGGRDGSPVSSSDERMQPLALGSTTTKVTWAPATISMSANPGARQAIPLTLRATTALSNVTVTVPAALKSVVSVAPTTLGNLAADQTTTVTITVAPGATESLRTISGSLTVRAGFAAVTNALPVTLTLVAPESIQGIAVPPEPPKELNDLTLAGFDMNGNGVRDDVERWIASATPNAARKHENLLLYAAATQRGLLASTKDDAIVAANDSAMAIECFEYLGIPKSQRQWKETLARLVNSESRLQAHELLQDRVSGTTFTLFEDENLRSACKFDIERLPN